MFSDCFLLRPYDLFCRFLRPRLLCLVLWLAAPGASPSVDGPDRDLMLPLHSEFRREKREQREQRHLFDVNLFDEPDERYDEFPVDTGTWFSWVLKTSENMFFVDSQTFCDPNCSQSQSAQRML